MKARTMTKSATAGRAPLVVLALLAAGASAVADDNAAARFKGTGRADPIRVKNVSVKRSGVGAAAVKFDLAWDHSWRAAWDVAEDRHGGKGVLSLENWDAAWVFIKFRKADADSYSHAMLASAAGEHEVPTGAKLDVGLSDDGKRGMGVFVYRRAPGHGPNDWKRVTLRWLYGADGVPDPGAIGDIKVLAIKMVYVPECPFWVGDGSKDMTGRFSAGRTLDPFRIEGEGPITLGGEKAENLGNRDSIGTHRAEDFTSGQTRKLPAAFPKGHAAFYCTRHEITQEGYVAFLNTLGYAEQKRMTRTAPDAKAGSRVLASARGAIKIAVPGRQHPAQEVSRRDGVVRTRSRAPTPAVYATDAPYVPCGGLNGMTSGAYAAWAGLRPMTELEYEKACRGPLKSVPNEYAWGTDKIAGTNRPEPPYDGYALKNPGKPDEHAVWEGNNGPDATRGNAVWNGTVTRTRGSYPAHAINGPLRVEIFATPRSGRVGSGASYWGIMELSGNLLDLTITVGSLDARRFAGEHGNGAPALPVGRNGFIGRGGHYGWRGDRHATLHVSNRGTAGSRTLGADEALRCVRSAPK